MGSIRQADNADGALLELKKRAPDIIFSDWVMPQSGGLALKEIEGDSGLAKAETCNDCRTYSKVLYEARDTGLDPVADDLATLSLDLLVADAGWSRHAPNPLLLAT